MAPIRFAIVPQRPKTLDPMEALRVMERHYTPSGLPKGWFEMWDRHCTPSGLPKFALTPEASHE